MQLGLSPLQMRTLRQRSATFGDYYTPNMMMYIPSMTSFAGGNTDTSYLVPEAPEEEAKPEITRCYTCANEGSDRDLIHEEKGTRTEVEEHGETEKAGESAEEAYEEEKEVPTTKKSPTYEEATTEKVKTYIATTRKSKSHRDDVPPFNVFFPMTFGYPSYHGSRSDGADNIGGSPGYPGGAVAIANSFSSGKGGVASSHATAFGNTPPVNKYFTSQRKNHHD